MLPEKYRLQKKKDIERAFQEGRSFKEDCLILKFAENGLDACRFAFIVSKKISPKAVDRNRIKRRLSEIVRAEIRNMKPGKDILLIAIKGAGKASFDEFGKTVKRLIERLELIN